MPVTVAQSPAKVVASVQLLPVQVGSPVQVGAPDPTHSSESALTCHVALVPAGTRLTSMPNPSSNTGRQVDPRWAPVASIRSPATGSGSTNVRVWIGSVPLFTARRLHSSVPPMTVLAALGETK